MRHQNIAGALLFIVGVVVIVGIIAAEATCPVYTTSQNDMGDLGATRPLNGIIKQPAATIFAAMLIVAGVLLIGSIYFVYRGLELGCCDRTLHPARTFRGQSSRRSSLQRRTEGSLIIHVLFVLLAFATGGLAAIVSYGVLRRPFSELSVVLCVIALACLALNVIFGEADPVFALIDSGGAEPGVVYPSVL